MREYGKVAMGFWTSESIAGLTDQAKLLALYLVSGPHSHGCGVSRVPAGYVAEDLGWNSDTVSRLFDELSQKGYAYRCNSTGWVVVMKALKHTPPDNPKHALNYLNQLAHVPRSASIMAKIVEAISSSIQLLDGETRAVMERAVKGLRDGFDTVSQTVPKQTETETETKTKTVPYQKIVDLYHKHLPDNPTCKVISAERKRHIAARWSQSMTIGVSPFKALPVNVDVHLASWEKFFVVCADSAFLTNKTQPSAGHATFKVDLDWMMNETNFVKILENKYHRGNA